MRYLSTHTLVKALYSKEAFYLVSAMGAGAHVRQALVMRCGLKGRVCCQSWGYTSNAARPFSPRPPRTKLGSPFDLHGAHTQPYRPSSRIGASHTDTALLIHSGLPLSCPCHYAMAPRPHTPILYTPYHTIHHVLLLFDESMACSTHCSELSANHPTSVEPMACSTHYSELSTNHPTSVQSTSVRYCR